MDHPGILEFIECKLDGGITSFNIPVAITQQFMNAYKYDLETISLIPSVSRPNRRFTTILIVSDLPSRGFSGFRIRFGGLLREEDHAGRRMEIRDKGAQA